MVAATSCVLRTSVVAVSEVGSDHDHSGWSRFLKTQEELKSGSLIWRQNVIKVHRILKAEDVLKAKLLTQSFCTRTESPWKPGGGGHAHTGPAGVAG